MAIQKATGIKRILNAFLFTFKGLRAIWHHEEAFRQEVIIFIVIVPLAIWLGESKIDTLLLIGCMVLVLLVEMINSAIEAVVDRIGLEHHELSGRAKDIGSAAVFIAFAWAAVTWIVILFV